MKSLEEIKKIINLKIVAIDESDGFAAIWTDPLDMRRYSIIVSWGGGWEHLSINPLKNDKTPSWDFMCRIKDMFWNENETCVEYHPSKEHYVNNMPHCLHIWKPTKAELPVPPDIFVGYKDLGELK